MKHLFIDLETFSSTDIKKSGNYKYCQSKDFEILLCGYMWDTDTQVTILDLSIPNELDKFNELFTLVRDNEGYEIVAHNATFERLCLKRYGFDIPVRKFFCTANMALYCGLPASLDSVSQILNLKDKKLATSGKALIKFFSVPCKETKKNGGASRNYGKNHPEAWNDFKTYLEFDVLSEKEIFEKLSVFEMPDYEREVYAADQRINDYGILADTVLAEQAERMNEQHKAEVEKEIERLYDLEGVCAPNVMNKYLYKVTGVKPTSLNKKSIPEYLASIPEGEGKKKAEHIMELRSEVMKTSNAKYTAILNCVGDGGRIRGLFRYYGANRTGRYAGRLVQLQNLPQNHIEDLDGARELAKMGDLNLMGLIYEKPTHILSQLIRTAFIAPEGMTFSVADFSAIEARVIAWVAQEQWRLDLFADPKADIYCASASKMFGYPVHKGMSERQQGKVAELALGYGGGVNALTAMDSKKALTEESKPIIVTKWREANPQIVGLWKSLENCAKACIATRREQIFTITEKAQLVFKYEKGAMTVKLPSGRKLFYPFARLGERTIQGANGDFTVKDISYMGQNQQTGKWEKQHTYGGKLTENIIQAIARDLLANAIFKVFDLGYNIVLHVHDEIAAEIPQDGNEEKVLEIMSEAMCNKPSWADGMILRAAGYITKYYKKD
nr:MAG TPA: DNA polymerase I [Caudoviricetes sp.]